MYDTPYKNKAVESPKPVKVNKPILMFLAITDPTKLIPKNPKQNPPAKKQSRPKNSV